MNSENLCDDIVNHTPCEHGEGDYDESTSDHDDSGYFCDSDSGISSLYKAIRRQYDLQRFKESENAKIYKHNILRYTAGNCTENILNLLNIDDEFWNFL